MMEAVLYEPGIGFYQAGGRAGADFLTSPEVGPLFGAVLARALDRWWTELGQPDPFVVIEAGAGPGSLVAAILGARSACAPALRYLLVERSAPMRQAQAAKLTLEPGAQVLGAAAVPGANADDFDASPPLVTGMGPLLASLLQSPAGPFTGVVLANELLDNLPFRLLQRTGDATEPVEGRGGWAEVYVDEHLAEVLIPISGEEAALAQALAPEAKAGARIPLQDEARTWLRAALACLGRGRVVCIDYADTTASMASRAPQEWVRTYRSHGRGGNPLVNLGRQDITCEVAVDQLAITRATTSNRSQADFLAAHGLDDLVASARQRWTERAQIGDLEALRARSRVGEAAALSDPAGLGAFRVLEWEID